MLKITDSAIISPLQGISMKLIKKLLLPALLALSAGVQAQNTLEKDLLSFFEPLKEYQPIINECKAPIKNWEQESANITIGFSQELQEINQLVRNHRKDDRDLKISILADNLQLSQNEQGNTASYNQLVNVLKNKGLIVVYQNQQIKNYPAINTTSSITILKKPNLNFANEQKKLNTYLQNVDRVYEQVTQCYRAKLNNKEANNKILDRGLTYNEKYKELDKRFQQQYPLPEEGTQSVLTRLLVFMSMNRKEQLVDSETYIKEITAKYNSNDRPKVIHLLTLVSQNPTTFNPLRNYNVQNEVGELYKEMLRWKLQEQEIAANYLNY